MLPTSKDAGSDGTLSAGDAAWLVAGPVAAVVVAAAVVLGKPLGSLLLSPSPADLYPGLVAEGAAAEPTEHARLLMLLSIPLLMVLGTVRLTRRRVGLAPAWVRRGVVATQVALGVLVVGCLVRQSYVGAGAVVAALVLAAATVAAARSPPLRAAIARRRGETRGAGVVAAALATVLAVVWMLAAVNSDRSLRVAAESVIYQLGHSFDEAYAVTTGFTPLVDFTPQYGSLWPFLTGFAMSTFGTTLLAFTVTMAAVGALALVAAYGVLRHSFHSPTAALLLYVPFVALALLPVDEPLKLATYGADELFGVLALCYAGPFLLAWATARHLDRVDQERPSRLWPVFAIAGLALLNSVGCGVAALSATAIALLTLGEWRRRDALRRLVGAAAAGLLVAVALVSLMTLVRAGSLPHPGRVLEYTRAQVIGGLDMLPLPGVGLELAAYLTYLAAIAAATVRAIDHAPNRTLTGMLAWSGTFGLATATYSIGPPDANTLILMLPAWGLALALLTGMTVSSLDAGFAKPSFAVLVGIGLGASLLVHLPAPWTQLDRIRSEASMSPVAVTEAAPPLVPILHDGSKEQYFQAIANGRDNFQVHAGAPVAILLSTGHRIAEAYDLVNVAPYSGLAAIASRAQLEGTIEALRRAGGNTLLLPTAERAVYRTLIDEGFEVVTAGGMRPASAPGALREASVPWIGVRITKWVDTRHLRAAALSRVR